MPEPAGDLRDAAKQFVSANMALVSSIETVGSKVTDCESANTATAAALQSVRDQVAGLGGQVQAIQNKPHESKAPERVMSGIALVVSIVGGAFSIWNGMQSHDLAQRTTVLENDKLKNQATQDILTLIRDVGDQSRQVQTTPGQPSPPGFEAAKIRVRDRHR